MFTIGHIVWLIIGIIVVPLSIYLIKKNNISLKQVLFVAGIIAIISEIVKFYSCMTMLEKVTAVYTSSGISYVGTGEYVPFLEYKDFPLELCSIQIFLIWIAYFMKDSDNKTTLLGFMFPTMILGGIVACLLPGPLQDYTTFGLDTFISARMIQFFLYHFMIIIVGFSIARSNEVHFDKKNCMQTIILMSLYCATTLYLNSLLSVAVYEDQQAIGIISLTNLLTTYLNPLGIAVTTKVGWLINIIIDLALGVIGVLLVYYPVLRRNKKQQSNK